MRVCTCRQCHAVSRVVSDDNCLLLNVTPPAPLSILIKKAFATDNSAYNRDSPDYDGTERRTSIRITATPHILVVQNLFRLPG